jgi:hypothetical protein
MEVVQNDLWLCTDCLMCACNGDLTGTDSDARAAEVEKAVAALGPGLVPDFDSDTQDGIEEFSWRGCDCCALKLGGSLHRFAILGEAT